MISAKDGKTVIIIVLLKFVARAKTVRSSPSSRGLYDYLFYYFYILMKVILG